MQSQTRSYVLSTLLVPPLSAGLTTLANVRDEMDLPAADTSNDNKLTRYITEESASISAHCNRVFGLATWQDEFRPQKGIWGEGVRAAVNPLMLRHWPLAAAPVGFSGNTHSSVLVDGISSTAGLYVGMPVFGAGVPAGASIATVSPFSITLNKPATVAAQGVGLNAGMNIVETIAGTSTQLIAGTDFQVEPASLLPGDDGSGFIYRLNEAQQPRIWPAAQIVVIYQAGYVLPNDVSSSAEYGVALPADLEGVCIRNVVGRFKSRDRDPQLRARDQPNTGREEFWVGAMPGQYGPYPNEIMAIIDRYRTPVTA